MEFPQNIFETFWKFRDDENKIIKNIQNECLICFYDNNRTRMFIRFILVTHYSLELWVMTEYLVIVIKHIEVR